MELYWASVTFIQNIVLSSFRTFIKLTMENIIRKMKANYPVSEDAIQLLVSNLTACHFPKKSILIREGAYCKFAYFIEKGITRSYWLVDGKEVTTYFSSEGDITFSMDELYYGKPSLEFVAAVENVELYSIPIDTLNHLFQINTDLANWGRVIHQNGYCELHRTHRERLTLSAKERYNLIKERMPSICNRINLGYLASYLGITLPTLSKIRALEYE